MKRGSITRGRIENGCRATGVDGIVRDRAMNRYSVGILGATGLVGQQLIRCLDGHPWFEPVALAASERSAGKTYAEAVTWRQESGLPASVAGMTLGDCSPATMGGCDLVFSALDSTAGAAFEPPLAKAGLAVVSNSSAHRMTADVPLVVPEVNSGHLQLIDAQRRRTGGGFVVTNPNCAAIGLALAVDPLQRAFGVRRMVVTTLQALSGAGASGPLALDLIDNVVPFISGEEEKIEREMCKIFGRAEEGVVRPAALRVSAHCHRVGTSDGHMAALSVELEQAATPEEARAVLRDYRGDTAGAGLPSAPDRPVELCDAEDRPQPRLDRNRGGGMAVAVGRVRRCPVMGLKLELLSHNTVRGAAGGTVLLAELLAQSGRLGRSAS